MRESKKLTIRIVDEIMNKPKIARDYLMQSVDGWSLEEKRKFLEKGESG